MNKDINNIEKLKIENNKLKIENKKLKEKIKKYKEKEEIEQIKRDLFDFYYISDLILDDYEEIFKENYDNFYNNDIKSQNNLYEFFKIHYLNYNYDDNILINYNEDFIKEFIKYDETILKYYNYFNNFINFHINFLEFFNNNKKQLNIFINKNNYTLKKMFGYRHHWVHCFDYEIAYFELFSEIMEYIIKYYWNNKCEYIDKKFYKDFNENVKERIEKFKKIYKQK